MVREKTRNKNSGARVMNLRKVTITFEVDTRLIDEEVKIAMTRALERALDVCMSEEDIKDYDGLSIKVND